MFFHCSVEQERAAWSRYQGKGGGGWLLWVLSAWVVRNVLSSKSWCPGHLSPAEGLQRSNDRGLAGKDRILDVKMFCITIPGIWESWVSPWALFPVFPKVSCSPGIRPSSGSLSETPIVKEKVSVVKDSRGQFSLRTMLEVSKAAGVTQILITPPLSAHCHPKANPGVLTPGLLGNRGRLTQGTQTSALLSPPPSPPHNSSWRESQLCLFR